MLFSNSNRPKKIAVITFSLVGIVLLLILGYNIAPGIRGYVNRERAYLLEVHYATDFETLKHVEDSCRAMISSYESDRMTYELYCDSDSEEKQGWAEQARMRANKTASTYNNYVLENEHIWQNAIPNDIRMRLEYIK